MGILAGSGASPQPGEVKRIATSFVNRNKRSPTLNLKTPDAQAVLDELATRYDVLVGGSRPGVMERWGGGDYATLPGLSEHLIYVHRVVVAKMALIAITPLTI